MLQLRCLNQKLEELDLMDEPDDASGLFQLSILASETGIHNPTVVKTALIDLWLLEALDDNGSLTPLGRQMAAFPLEPGYARAILAAKDLGCTSEVIDIISILSASSKLFVDISDKRDAVAEARKMFRHTSGDHLTTLNAVRAYHEIASESSRAARRDWCRKHFLNERTLLEAFSIRSQLQQTCSRLKIDAGLSCGDKDEPILRSLSFGLRRHSALLQPDGSYKQTMGRSVSLHHVQLCFHVLVGSNIFCRPSRYIPAP
jgi:HrpA-like RNA helicase